jgi:hypothetical protein
MFKMKKVTSMFRMKKKRRVVLKANRTKEIDRNGVATYIRSRFVHSSVETICCGLLHWGMRKANKILVGKPEEKRSQGRSTRRRNKNIKMHLGETGSDGMDRTQMVKARVQWRALVRWKLIFWFHNKRKFP